MATRAQKAGTSKPSAMLNRKVKPKELLIFTRQLSTMVNAGLPLLTGLDILAEQTEDQSFAPIIDAVRRDVENGEGFCDSLGKFSRAFPDLYVSMVHAGEEGGNLDGTLLQLADYIEASEELKRRIKSAMSYPVFAFGFIMVITIGLIVWLVPQFAEIFAQLGGPDMQLPAPTRMLVAISDILRSWRAFGVAAAIVGIVVGVKFYAKTESGLYNLDAVKLRLPVFGPLLRKVAISRFARTLSTLIRSGVPIIHALEIVERTTGNEVFAKAVREAGASVRGGENLSDPLARCEQFPAMVTRMIAVGEEAGALETMLVKISDFYDSEVRATVDAMASLIEPIMIVMMGVVVGGIVIALFMPIFQMPTLLAK